MPGKDPVYLSVQQVELPMTICSWCGVKVATEEQQKIHSAWHRAVGVIPLGSVSQDAI
jgi:hypothetical protein